MKKRNPNISIVLILMLMIWLLVPLASNIFTSIGISLSVLSLLCLACFIYMFVSDSRLRNFPIHLFFEMVMLILWTCWSAYIYDTCNLVEREQTNFIFFEINSYASFYPQLLIMLLPTIGFLIYLKDNKTWTKIIEILFIVMIIVNLIIQIRAIIVYPDAVRAPETAEEMGYGYLLGDLVGYSHIYSIALLVPCMFYKCLRNDGRKKIIPIILLVLSIFMIFTSNLATAGIIAILGIVSYLFFANKSKYKGAIVILLIICVFFFSFSFDTILGGLANMIGVESAWGKKLLELSYLFAGEGFIGDVQGRTEFYSMSWESFVESPIFGALFNSSCNIGMHSTLLDILAATGIFGLVLFGGIIYFSYRAVKKSAYYKINPAVIKAIYVEFLALVILKNTITSYAIYGVMFVGLPLYFYLYAEEEV